MHIGKIAMKIEVEILISRTIGYDNDLTPPHGYTLRHLHGQIKT